MPKKIQKSLQGYLSKITTPNSHLQSIISGCKHPKTLSFAIDGRNDNEFRFEEDGTSQEKKNEEATLEDIDRFLVENFKSLYVENEGDETKEKKKGKALYDATVEAHGKNLLLESPRFIDVPSPSCLRGTQRFFVAPGSSGSLVDEAAGLSWSLNTGSDDNAWSTSSTSTNNTLVDKVRTLSSDTNDRQGNDSFTLPEDCIAVIAYSPSPYDDFRRSMQQMVDARLVQYQGSVDWDFMEELLICYLNVNEKKSHKYILSAFVDIVLHLRQDSPKIPVTSTRLNVPPIATEVRRRKSARN